MAKPVRKFYIKSFDDYHDIIHPPKGWKSIELGCLPQEGYSYWRYFGLFYKGRKPSLDKIWNNLKNKVSEGYDHYYYEHISMIDIKQKVEACLRSIN
jgi:hypothetical protein